MTPFSNVAQAEVFLTVINKSQVYGMKARSMTGIEVVLHILHPSEPKLVDAANFVNRDVLVLHDVALRLPEVKHAMEEVQIVTPMVQ